MRLRRRHRWLFLIVTLTAFILSQTASLAHACVIGDSVGSHSHHVMGKDAAMGRSPASQHCHACPDNGTKKVDPWCAFHCQGSVATQPLPTVLACPPCALLHDIVLTPVCNGDAAVATLPPASHAVAPTSSRRSILARFCALLI
jgi:hypothetical protein